MADISQQMITSLEVTAQMPGRIMHREIALHLRLLHLLGHRVKVLLISRQQPQGLGHDEDAVLLHRQTDEHGESEGGTEDCDIHHKYILIGK
jgi:hypothetical protein